MFQFLEVHNVCGVYCLCRFLRGELQLGGVFTEGLQDTWQAAGHKTGGLTFSALDGHPTKRVMDNRGLLISFPDLMYVTAIYRTSLVRTPFGIEDSVLLS